MFLSWLHRSWKFFWTIILSLLMVILVLGGTLIGIMQMESSKKYLAGWIERSFNESYQARLDIGMLDGWLPFEVSLNNIRVTLASRSDSASVDTLIRIDRIDAGIDVLSLLRNDISVNGFSMVAPTVRLYTGEDGRYTIYKALSRRNPSGREAGEPPAMDLSRVEIIAPGVTITDGKLAIEGLANGDSTWRVPDPLVVRNIDASMFLELSDAQRFWDIESLSAHVDGVQTGDLQISGQIYNNSRFLEFNAFTFSAGNSDLRLNGEIDGVDLYREHLRDQLRAAHYNVEVASSGFVPAEFRDLVAGMPEIDEPLEFYLQAEGKVDSLWVDDFSLGVGESFFRINGFFEDLTNWNELQYQFNIADVVLRKRDVEIFSGSLDEQQFDVLEGLQFQGKAGGTEDSLSLDLSLESPYGQLELRGHSQLVRPFRYTASLSGRNVSLGDLIATGVDSTDLSFDVTTSGLGRTLDDAVMELDASVYNSSFNGIPVEHMELSTSVVSGFLRHDYEYQNGPQTINGSGWIDFSQEEPPLSLQGNARNINLSSYFVQNQNVPSSSLNFDYNVELRGLTPDRMRGRANIDVKASVLGSDSLQSHQLYMDIDSPDQDIRSFRLTSSILDFSVTGKIVPSNIVRHINYWAAYAQERVKEEIFLDTTTTITTAPLATKIDPLVLDGSLKAKNLALIKKYWPEFPTLATDMQLGFNINADSSRLLLSSNVRADSLRYKKWELDNSSAQLTASFRRFSQLKEYSNIDFESNIRRLSTDLLSMDSLRLDLAFSRDSLQFTQSIGRFSNEARMNLVLNSTLTDSVIHMKIQDFFLGNDSYAWKNEATPELRFNRRDELHFDKFSFKNQDEYFELKGTLSPDRSDSLMYVIKNVNLERISDLIDGRIRFSGTLNGNLLTRSLTSRPSVQGQLTVNRLAIQNRLVGDAVFSSTYNAGNDRFDTQVKLITDPVKYDEYLEDNDNIGQNIVLDGYFIPPDPDVPQDTLYNFDVRFNEIDMWVLPLIVKVFDSMEGRASGEGYIRGNLNDFDFHADFQTSNVFAKPRFLETNYFLNGHVALDRQDGVVIDSVDVTDTQGGRGVLWGTVDLNDFKPITFLDLSFQLNRLQFLNNAYDPDVPFYGTVAGTGQVRLTGANTDLFLQTVEPIEVSSQSTISIPLIEETELSQNGKFIQFVEEFDPGRKSQVSLDEERLRQTTLDDNILENAIDDLTFNERFNLDLQFEAPENVNVNLIFDPVTGEVLTANGTGQVRITMQNEEVQMFGRYNINGGEYQFVSGEIFTRRLELESGGSISWQGDPANASLNISAVYRARPSVASLTYQNGASGLSEGAGTQRFPVDLILEINGTVSSVQNNYYFRLPNSLDISTNSALSFTINQINRDEQQKLLQATSVLLTGNFIPTQSYNEATSTLRENLTRRSTVINPLISSQVISPLLSNQMNALLNSDVSRFDVDFNLNAYNEIDLGIALRLYNDKLIFRREGQITGGGPESTFGDRIGDLNATYRINEGLSVTAFHRQDQTLGNFSNSKPNDDITPSVDGIGIEAKVQFNTWQDLANRIKNTFRRLLGIKPDNEEQAPDRRLTSSDQSSGNKNKIEFPKNN